VLDQRIAAGDYYLPAEHHMFVILAVHNLVGKGAVQSKHLTALQRCAAGLTVTGLQKSLPQSAQLVDALAPLLESVENYAGDHSSTRELRVRLNRILQKNDPRSIFYRARRGVARFMRRWTLIPRAPLYVLLGGDGVGKSSLCAALIQQFNAGEQLRAVEIYMGPWGHYQLPFMKGELFVPGWSVSTSEWWRGMTTRNAGRSYSLGDVVRIGRKTVTREQLSGDELSLHQAVKEHSRLYLTARYVRSVLAAWKFLATLMLEMCYRYYKAYKLRRRGTIVIGDRYIYDLMTGRMHEEIQNYARTRRFMCKVFFRPTRVFLLVNDPDVILARKQDLTADQLERFSRVYDRLATDYGFVRIKTDRPPEDIAADLIDEHFGEIMRFYRR